MPLIDHPDSRTNGLAGHTEGPVRQFACPQVAYFIFACPKSGTTWLQRLLSAHPSAPCAESRAFGDYYCDNPLSRPHLTLEKYLQIVSHHFAPAVARVAPENREFQRTLLFNVLDTLAATAIQATGKRVYGEKLTPYRGTALPAVQALREYHPLVKFIHLTRDGRDVIVSGAAQWMNLRLHRATEDQKPILTRALAARTIGPEDFEMFLEYWLDAVTAGLKARALFPNYLHASYERLVAEPESQTRRLLEFLELDSSPEVLRSCLDAASFAKLSGGRARGEEDRRNFFRKGVAGDWPNWFSVEQTAVFAQRAGDLLRQLDDEAARSF